MNKKILKKLKEKEEKLIDVIYEIQELLDSTEDPELSAMGDEFCEALLDFVQTNDTISLNDIREAIESDYE